MAETLSEKGQIVELVVSGEGTTKGDVSDYIEKVGAVLSKKNKAIIQTAVEGIDALKTNLETLLNLSTNDTSGKGDVESDAVQKDSASDTDDGENSGLYGLMESLTEKVKTV